MVDTSHLNAVRNSHSLELTLVGDLARENTDDVVVVLVALGLDELVAVKRESCLDMTSIECRFVDFVVELETERLALDARRREERPFVSVDCESNAWLGDVAELA